MSYFTGYHQGNISKFFGSRIKVYSGISKK